MNVVSLDNIVKNVMVQLDGDNNFSKYQKYLQFAIRGMRELNLTSAPFAKTVHLEMLDNKAVNLPTDYIQYTKVGICVNGRVLILGLDNTLCLNDNYSECGDPLEIAMANLSNAQEDGVSSDGFFGFGIGYPFLDGFVDGQWVGGLYGVGGGFNSRGYFRVNEAMSQIQFTSNVPSETIILEYISDGINPDGTASVPKAAIEALITWVIWKSKEYQRGVSLSEVEYARQQYIIQFRKYRHINLSFTVQDYLASQAVNIHQAPKR